MELGLKYQNQEKIFLEREEEGVPFLEFPLLTELGVVKHGFSTRLGGVSEEIYASMNLSFARGDEREHVKENFHRFARAMGVLETEMVCSAQVHDTQIRVVTKEDSGKGLLKPIDYSSADGLVTNIPGICLVTFYADCVPLYFVDPVKKVIGLSHSGWRGTVGKIGRKTVETMEHEYGCDPKDIRGAIGPSICQDCYEVSEDVISEFQKGFSQGDWEELFFQKGNGKYQLNLWKANELVMKEAGILKEHIAVTNLCTCCNRQLLFSHRGSNGKRGNMGAFLALKK
ncbi:MAG: peptidoglycan editing factor PgeF [Lachnospiraceae bacterium]